MSKRLCWRQLCGWAFAGAMVIPLPSASSQVHEQAVQAPIRRMDAPTASQGGSSTAGIFAPILDSERRPITAGGFVKTGPVVFEDTSARAGLTNWHHTMGTLEKKYILEETGSGACLLDYDHDGWLDIYLVNGSTYDALAGKAEAPHATLFHNNHDGTFTNVATLAGVTNDRWGYGCAVGDYDNDGWPDLYVTNFGKNRLYHNNHNGTSRMSRKKQA
jgi:enediyne biosynthesis protein E4